MKLSLATLLLAGASAQHLHMRQRIMYNLRIWVNGAAHCAEYATTDNEIDMEKANECRRCWAQVGDWATDAGYEKGNECLDTYEPSFREACGEKMDAWKEGGYTDRNIQTEVDECWEDVYLRTMSEKCAESTEDMNMGALCVVTHQTQNLEYAKLKVYGEEKRAVIHKPTHYEDMLQSVFEEGYCEHANGDNSERKTECMMCYQHVRKEANKMWENVDNSVTIDTSAMRRMFAMYMFCADTYLAPIYSECFEDVDDLVTHIEEANTEEWGKKLLADQGCMFLKQYQHYFSDCAEGAGEGADGLVSYIHCARNTTMTWTKERRPDAYDTVYSFLRGGSWMSMDGDMEM